MLESMARSFPPLGSLALEVTETRNVMIGPTVPAGTVYGTLIVAVGPTVSVPKLQDRTEDAPTVHDPCDELILPKTVVISAGSAPTKATDVAVLGRKLLL